MSSFQPGAQRRLVRSLADAGVDFVLIGGLAVAAHGYERATRDVDLVFSTSAPSCERLATVLANLGSEVELADHPLSGEAITGEWLGLGGHFRFATDAGPLDALSAVAGFTFEDIAAEAIEVRLGESTVRVCSRDHLIAMKRSGGRPRDEEDLRELEDLAGGPVEPG